MSEPKPPPPKKPIASPKGLATSKPLKSPHEFPRRAAMASRRSPQRISWRAQKRTRRRRQRRGRRWQRRLRPRVSLSRRMRPLLNRMSLASHASAMPRAEALELPYDTDKSPLSCLDLSDSTTVSVHQPMEQSRRYRCRSGRVGCPIKADDMAGAHRVDAAKPIRPSRHPPEPPFGGGGGGMLNSTKEYDEIAPILSAATHHYPPVDMEASSSIISALAGRSVSSECAERRRFVRRGVRLRDKRGRCVWCTKLREHSHHHGEGHHGDRRRCALRTKHCAVAAGRRLPPPVGLPSHAAPSSEPLIPPSTAPAPAAVAVAWAPGTEEPMPVVLGVDGRPPRSGRKSSGKSGKEPGSERNKEGGDRPPRSQEGVARARSARARPRRGRLARVSRQSRSASQSSTTTASRRRRRRRRRPARPMGDDRAPDVQCDPCACCVILSCLSLCALTAVPTYRLHLKWHC